MAGFLFGGKRKMTNEHNPEEELLKVLVTDEMVWALKRRARKNAKNHQRLQLLALLEQKSIDGTLSSVERILWSSFKLHPKTPEARRIFIQTEFAKLKKRASEDHRKSLAMLEV